MHEPTLDERVASLEKQVAGLLAGSGNGAPAKDWRSTLGMFSGNQAMKEIDAAGQSLRERERRVARAG